MSIKSYKRFSRKMVIIVLFLSLISLPCWGYAQQTFITISSAEGKTEEMVDIEIRIEGITNLSGVEGISGGEFEILYNSQIASIVNASYIKRGELIEDHDDWLFIRNASFTDTSLKVTWASMSNVLITKDGAIIKITFLLKADGPVRPTIKNISLYDQEVRPVAISIKESETENNKDSNLNETKENDSVPTREEESSRDNENMKEKNGDTQNDSGKGNLTDTSESDDIPIGEEELTKTKTNSSYAFLVTLWLGLILTGSIGYFIFRFYKNHSQFPN